MIELSPSWFLPRETGFRDRSAVAHAMRLRNRIERDRDRYADWRKTDVCQIRETGGMNDQQTLGVDIYIGAPIEHDSERTRAIAESW